MNWQMNLKCVSCAWNMGGNDRPCHRGFRGSATSHTSTGEEVCITHITNYDALPVNAITSFNFTAIFRFEKPKDGKGKKDAATPAITTATDVITRTWTPKGCLSIWGEGDEDSHFHR